MGNGSLLPSAWVLAHRQSGQRHPSTTLQRTSWSVSAPARFKPHLLARGKGSVLLTTGLFLTFANSIPLWLLSVVMPLPRTPPPTPQRTPHPSPHSSSVPPYPTIHPPPPQPPPPSHPPPAYPRSPRLYLGGPVRWECCREAGGGRRQWWVGSVVELYPGLSADKAPPSSQPHPPCDGAGEARCPCCCCCCCRCLLLLLGDGSLGDLCARYNANGTGSRKHRLGRNGE